ncbi:FMRFamide receptor-like [Brachionus plicatilis]|uniref:FMRFamide receptor-like n=1 Tax=Brachionus plicatilis TaxID=10195 RepID=A0A3M7Q5W1_BRAPC|nr:FMRFamide receptor-like [Brachionus plicatilis]
MASNQSVNYSQCSSIREAELISRLTDTILLIYPWIMIIFGSISNSITFIVLTRPKLRKSSTFFYLSCLSIIDLASLYTFCVNFVLVHNLGIDLQLHSILFCKVYSFLIYFLPHLSAWTCVAVSLDRVVGVIFSVRGKYASTARKWNTPRKAFHVMLVIFSSLFLLNMHFFFYPSGYDNIDKEIKNKDVNLIYCSLEHFPDYEAKYRIWVLVDLYVNVLIPFAIMLISSVIIVHGILRSTKNLAQTLAQESTRFSDDRRLSFPQVRPKSSNSTASQSDPLVITRKSINLIKRASTAFTSSVSSKARNVSYMLAANNIVFISLTLPIVVYLSVQKPIDQLMCEYDKSKAKLIKIICIILMNSNCTVNIFIYSFMASEFRHQLFELINLIFKFFFGPRTVLIKNRFSMKSDFKSTKQNSSGDFPESQSKRASSSK